MDEHAITYTIAMPQPHTHLFHVTMWIGALAGDTLNVALPVWTPGSYMVREYARHIQEFSAEVGGREVPWRKLDKSTWQIDISGAEAVEVRYKVYANDLSVRTSHLDGSHGYFNPTNLCMYVPGRLNEPHHVTVEAPAGWHVSTGLPSAGSATTFLAQDFDELADSPFECGTHRLLRFEALGVPHEIALWGHGNEDEQRLIDDTKKIVESAASIFGGLPYTYYLFIVHLADRRGGGLEHRNSVSMMVDRWIFQPFSAYESYLALTAHEFFHVWNVKRIRAAPLGPFDYSRENYTRQLWTMEGVTDYYTEYMLLRAGFISGRRYLELLAEKIRDLQGQPGRRLQSLETASFDAWIKAYRPDENSINTAISYYLKGDLVATLLDMELRARSGGTRSMDDVVRALFKSYTDPAAPSDDPTISVYYRSPGIAEGAGYREAVEAVLGEAGLFEEFWARYVAGTEELDYDTALAYAGLRIEWPDTTAQAWTGLRIRGDNGRLVVASVLADGPAADSGIYAGDELVALDGFRVNEASLNARLRERQPGETVTFALFRRDELLLVPLTLGAVPLDLPRIVPVDHPTAAQQAVYAAWIGQWERK